MQFFELVAHLGRQLGLPSLVAGPDGACAIRLDDLVIRFQHVPQARAVDLTCPLGRASARDLPRVRELLAGREAPGPFCSEAGQIQMRQRFFLQAMAFPNFFKALERFTNDADHWRDRLRRSGLEIL